MLKTALLILSLFISSAGAEPPMLRPCPTEGKAWDGLVQEFVADWRAGEAGFCEFKRLLALNTMITSDMRMNHDQYEKRISELEAFGDQSEPVNYLLASFQETWFNLYFDSIMDREYERGKTRWAVAGLGAGSASLFCLSLPFTRTWSSKGLGVLRGFVANFFGKRAIAYGLTSGAKGATKFRVGADPGDTITFVRPPLLYKTGGEHDTRTKDIYVNEFWKQMRIIGEGVGAGWFAGHVASVGVKKWVAPKWSNVVSHAWARGKVADILSPGLLAGLPVTVYVTEKISDQTKQREFFNSIETTKASLLTLAKRVNEAVASSDEYQIWLRGEQLKNGLMLQNYMLTSGMGQSLADESERAVRRVLSKLHDCWRVRREVLDTERAVFEKRVKKLIAAEEKNLKAAIDITDAVQNSLLDQAHAMTAPLIDTGLNTLKRDRWLMDANELTEDFWGDVEAAVRTSQSDCGLVEQVSHP